MMSVTSLSTFLSYLHVDICPVVDQELQTECSVCGSCSKMQRRESLVVGLADVGAAVDQLAGDCVLAVKAGQVERRVPKSVGLVNLWSPRQHRELRPVCLRLCACVCVCIYLHGQVEQMLDHSDLSTGGCCVQGGVPSFVLTADLSPLIYQQAHYIQMTCRGTPTLNAHKD